MPAGLQGFVSLYTQALLKAVYPFKGGRSCDLDVCGLHGDHVTGQCDLIVNSWAEFHFCTQALPMAIYPCT